MGLSSWIFVAFATVVTVSGEVLSPPYFNLAEGSSITASSTCGVDIPTSKERFCRLTGASADERRGFLTSVNSLYYSGNSQIIAGQLCDYCVAEGTPEGAENPAQVHSAKFAIDSTERWWQSPPLSRGSQFDDVNLTVSLGQEFHVAYVFIKMGNSPRPGVWALERSTDNGQTWKAWQYFADTSGDCMNFFDTQASDTPTNDDDVICTTEFSKIVPLEGGEIAVSLVQDRPGSLNFSRAPELQEFTKATNVRLSLRRTKTLQGHLMQLARQDPTVTRRYFYSVKDITIGGRCVCNGHANTCDKQDQFKRVCECQHNTCGDNCDQCCEPFVQKKWRKATEDDAAECEPCQCFGHSDECAYDEEIDRLGLSIDVHGNYEGGGVCQNCRDNTRGTNCDQCVTGYYRPPGKSLFDKDVCQPCQCDLRFTTGDCDDNTGVCHCLPQYTGEDCRECAFGFYDPPQCKPCDCFLNGTYGDVCEVGGGQCPCKDNFDGPACDKCADGYWNFPECEPCSCGGVGAQDNACDQDTAQCNCGFEFSGTECDKCQVGYFSYPDCTFCDCDTTGTEDGICDDKSGQCICKENYTGDRCDQCAAGYYSYPECLVCDCDTTGTINGSMTCNDQGQCQCEGNFGGKKCADCAPGYHNYPTCKGCDCDLHGSFGTSCDQASAQCECRLNFIGLKCSQCAPERYNFPTCEACSCNPAGAMPVEGYPLGGCGSFDDGKTLCECKENVEGHICDQCKPGFYDLTKDNADGCKECTCHLPGTLIGDNMCDPVTGQCLCKVNVNSEYCQACIPGTYNLEESSVFGCEDCNCDMGGASSTVCNAETGQCVCRPRVQGRACNKPIQSHYFPTLHQLKYELEDGYNPTDDDGAVRFGFEDTDFPDFSWRGYAVFSRIQPEVRVVVDIAKPSVFRLIYRYINRNLETVPAEVTVTPEDPNEDVQTGTVEFPSIGSAQPEFLTTDLSLVLGRGRWTIATKTPADLNVDYLVLIPQPYYEGAVLQDKLRNPCMVPESGEECLHYTYLDLSQYNQVDGGEATRPDGQDPLMETNRDILLPLDSPQLAQLEDDQLELVFNLSLKEPGKYIVVIGYTSPLNKIQPVTVTMIPEGGNSTMGKAMLYECQYSSLCRQVVIDMDTGKHILDTPVENVTVIITADPGTAVSIGYVAAVPEDEWKDEIVKAEVMCVQVNGDCVESTYPFLPEAIKQDVMSSASNVSDELPPGVSEGTKLVKLDTENTISVPFDDIESKSYAIVANYYQPDDLNVPVNVSVDVNGVMYTGYFDASYCPNTAGCNSVVNFDDILIHHQIIDVLSKDAVVNIKPLADEDANVWLDTIQMIPTSKVDDMMPMLQMFDPYDLSERYVLECTDNELDPEKGQISPFCRSSIFSVTTEYNNGALSCDCDAQGSETFQCSEFGGQCRCKPNVIGRTCNACAQNYYGFPDCKPCNCPATCNAVTGACECPKRVTGPNCDQCAPQTFGYDRTIGCMDCKCEPEGVLNGNLDCDLDTGACDCKANVVGRTCDVCENGFWNYPDCEQCNCDPAGTTQTICDRQTSTCSCKENTGGLTCGECQPGTYNLQSTNPEGCTQCFCFGITSTCTSSTLIRTEIMNMSAWGLTNVNGSAEVLGKDDMVMAMLKDGAAIEGIAMYWLAPEDYLGNRLTSYGGDLKYTVSNFGPGIGRGDTPQQELLPGPDIQISGNDMILSYELLKPMLDQEISIKMVEDNWRHAQTARAGEYVTREQFMKVLAAIDEMLVKANHYANVTEVTLTKVMLSSAEEPKTSDNSTGASETLSSDFALTVEMCQCPPNYAGTSCEVCADGFFRKINEQGDFVCIPCQCNGHSETCDRETGVCSGCTGNTQGDHCEECLRGYTGEPQIGEVCVICACPMAIESNNFANTCVLNPLDPAQTLQCDCLPGFMPPFCDYCGPGYHGDPKNISNGLCEPCDCNGNIDASNPGSCDPSGGACLICLNDTQGNSCEECKDFYWGDAINTKNCQECDCDEVGTDSCNKTNGQCICKPNVIGDRCDTCAADTWDFLSGNGCSHCNCSVASNGTQCDPVTGMCACQQGVTGSMCESCLPQHWDFTADGCKSCQCELDGAVGCNVDTGVCQCLAGVTGDKCDRCEDRWVLIPEQGCEACDNCVHTLLDDTDILNMEIANASDSLYIINIGVEARKRLEQLNQTTQNLKEQLANVPKASLDTSEIDALVDNLTEVQNLASMALKEALNVETTSNSATDSFNALMANMTEAQDSKKDAFRHLQDILDYIEDRYMDILNSSELGDVNKLMKDARDLLDKMEEREPQFDQLLDDAVSAKNGSEHTLKRVEEWQVENTDLSAQFDELSMTLDDTTRRLRDLQEKAQDALTRSGSAEELLESVKEAIAELQENTATIKTVKENIEKTLEEAAQLTSESEDFIRNATDTFMKLEEDLTRLETMVENLDDLYDDLSTGNVEARPKVDEAIAHADSLRLQASDLSSLLDEASEAAIKAANAYSQIVTSINEAYNASQDALDKAMQAIQEIGFDGNGTSSNIQNITEQVRAESVKLLEQAELAKNETESDLRVTLQNSIDTIEGLEANNENIDQKYSEMLYYTDNLKENHESEAEMTRTLIQNHQQEAEDATESVQPILDTIDSDLEMVKLVPVLQKQMGDKLLQIKSHMDTINNILPNVTSLTEKLNASVPDLRASRQQLNTSISALRQKIDAARATANRIKVALKSNENTSVEIRAPDGFSSSLQRDTRLSLFFQTVEENGLLMYVGPKGSTSSAIRRRRAMVMPMEYLALELVDGHVMWKYNLGDTPAAAIQSNRTYNDGKWHHVVATRLGKEGTLLVRTDKQPDDEVDGSSGGMFTQLDLSPQTTKIYAGGVPDNFTLPPEVVNRRFIGGLDDFSYSENDIRLGLWNFADGKVNSNGTLNRGGELAGNTSNSVRFISSSDSFITINKGTLSASSEFSLTLKFTTLNRDGIIFFMGQDMSSPVDRPDYFKLYMKDGKISASIELGAGEMTATLPRNIDDGLPHEIIVKRKDNMLYLEEKNAESNLTTGPPSPSQLNLGSNPEIHIGGIPKDSNYYGSDIVAVHPYFDGCVSDLSMNGVKKNILVNNEARVGVATGCKLVKRGVTFTEPDADDAGTDADTGYVHIVDDVIMVGENFTLGMSIKTTDDDGLLFYASEEDEDKYAYSVAIKDGKIVVRNTAGNDNSGIVRRNEIETMNKYNDGAWHYISITKEGLSLLVIVDDSDRSSADGEHRGRKTKTSPTFGYFLGGIRPEVRDYIAFKDNSPTWDRFVGCMRDVTIQKVKVDFAVSRPQGNYADYSQCDVADPVDPDTLTTPASPPDDLVSDEPTTEGPKRCSLPQEPDVKNLEEEGTRFGLDEDSRFEFQTIAGFQTDIRKELRLNNNIRMVVKTFATEGMIWFIGDVKDFNPDYTTIYLENGKVVYKCNLGQGPSIAVSTKAINDGKWHIIEIMRMRDGGVLSGYMQIDEEEKLNVTWPEGASSLNVKLPIYVGGLDMTDSRYGYMAVKVGKSSAASLVGCIDKLEYKGKDGDEWTPYGTETKSVNTQSCFENQEDGAFMPTSGGALALDSDVKIGVNQEVEVFVRPRSNTGVVLLVWGGGDYLGIELDDGKVKVNINNGGGDIEAAVDVPDICDGQWRKITVVKKEAEVTLSVVPAMQGVVEEYAEATATGPTSSTNANTNSPVYVGSVPEAFSSELTGSRYKPVSQTGYVGCIRSVRVGDKTFNMSRARRIGDVAKTCPTT